MLFNSLIFIAFAIVFFTVWHLVKKNTTLRLSWITLTSLFFYGWWDWRFLFLIFISGIIDYIAALFIIRKPKAKRAWLIISIIGNIGSLSVFKYSAFFAENITKILGFAGIQTSFFNEIPQFFLITPIGISFYTFQSMSYTIDVYRNQLKPTKNILQFFSYLVMFPQLVAGPIVRAKQILPQLLYLNESAIETWKGVKLIIRGYFKKMVIADNLAPFVVSAFSNNHVSDSTNYWWGIMAAFAFQIYCDFSGYTDIARGLGKWMGLDIPKNFNHPYLSTSLREFWQRWHISLSTWFRDYVYIPLGGSKKGRFRGDVNMWITMLLSGLWHGASWTYVIWGAWHAFFLTFERIIKKALSKVNFPDASLLIFKIIKKVWLTASILMITWTGWVFFRAENFNQALHIIQSMYSFNFTPTKTFNLNYWIILGIIVLRELTVAFNLMKYWPHNKRIFDLIEVSFYGFIIAIILFFRGQGNEFIYFQF